MKTFGQRLKELRITNNVKQKELSELLGVTIRSIVYYETDKREPNIAGLIVLADYFNVSLDYLLGRSDHMDGLTPIALRAREKELLEKLPAHLTSAYFQAKSGQSLSELERIMTAFEDMSKTKNLEPSFISRVLEKFLK